MKDSGERQIRVERALQKACEALLAERNAEGFWEGCLSSSALSTAVAVSAFSVAGENGDAARLVKGAQWLLSHQNGDGSWGDTEESPGNPSTTLLVLAALRLAREKGAGMDESFEKTLKMGAAWVERMLGRGWGVEEVQALYGEDRTFAAPILMNCALAGGMEWGKIPGLPFELAALPAGFYRAVNLNVVSYALPALIAVGLVLHRRGSRAGLFCDWLRRRVTPWVLRKLWKMQPESGGYLEAVPLTGFVVMSLAGAGERGHPAAARGLEFLRRLQREDGSWPIDANLSVWLTTNAVRALKPVEDANFFKDGRTAEWLSRCQAAKAPAFVGDAPGGWAWTHLPGGIPDADDTAMALLALAELGTAKGVEMGVDWLLNLQNRDGGWPTFCRGWGRLPFDRSAPDITAHVIQALWKRRNGRQGAEIMRALKRAEAYLRGCQRANGSWVPLWFGNQREVALENPVMGTAAVLPALAVMGKGGEACSRRGVEYLLKCRHPDGGWGGGVGLTPTVEETAQALIALGGVTEDEMARQAVGKGMDFLTAKVESGEWRQSHPLGLYFAKLWYSEKLYPLIWTVHALGQCRGMI
ncbi:MAG: prenyltransferase/squalene oxidase repeat-containing protein [Verrucomicrobiae bacterium]|nr:prenyltransferase/squalene oxidase repeat-containing protein [Verrucomicrobiae bacterium]